MVVANLEETLGRLAREEKAVSRERDKQNQEEEFQRRLEQEKRLEAMRLEMRMQLEKKEDKKPGEDLPKTKLPKLVISKFEGTPLDWFRFWNQFESEIDKQVHIKSCY